MDEWFEVVRSRPVRARFLGEADSERPFDQAVAGYLVEVEPGVCRHFPEQDFWQEWQRFEKAASSPPAADVPAIPPQLLSAAILKLVATILQVENRKLADRLVQVLSSEIGSYAQGVDGILTTMADKMQPPAPTRQPDGPAGPL